MQKEIYKKTKINLGIKHSEWIKHLWKLKVIYKHENIVHMTSSVWTCGATSSNLSSGTCHL